MASCSVSYRYTLWHAMFRRALIIFCVVIFPYGSGVCAGDVHIRTTTNGPYQQVEADGIIDGPRDEVWRQITDFNRHAEFMPNVRVSRIVGKRGNHYLVYKEMRVAMQSIAFTIEVSLDPKRYTQSWRKYKGNFARNEGSWRLEKLENGRTHLYYKAIIEPNFYIPDFIKEILTRQSIPQMYAAINKRVKNR